METEEKALNHYILQPKCFYHYVDDTFIIWPNRFWWSGGIFARLNLITSSNSQSKSRNTGLSPFWTYGFTEGQDVKHVVHTKLTHTDVYLDANSFHRLAQNHSILSMLVCRTVVVSYIVVFQWSNTPKDMMATQRKFRKPSKRKLATALL